VNVHTSESGGGFVDGVLHQFGIEVIVVVPFDSGNESLVQMGDKVFQRGGELLRADGGETSTKESLPKDKNNGADQDR